MIRAEYQKQWREANKEHVKEQAALYYQQNKEKIKLRAAKWSKDNPEKMSAHRRKWEQENPAAYAASRKKYYEANRGAFNARAITRHQARRNRTPSWADIEAIKFFYECCPKGCHVDHIIPLNGELVSGLHVAENLQWLPAAMNLSKGNKHA